jgi:hypothetical protein
VYSESLFLKIGTCCIDCTGNLHCHNSILGEFVTKNFLGHFSAPFPYFHFSVQNRPQVQFLNSVTGYFLALYMLAVLYVRITYRHGIGTVIS